MKVLIIFLDYDRHEFTNRALGNLVNAGYPFDLVTIQRKGIAAAINQGLSHKGYDGYVTMSNDIILPDNWLREMVSFSQRIPLSGLIGIHTVESLPPINKQGIHPVWNPFGNIFITAPVVGTIGGFNTYHDPYGMQDSDYSYRASRAGFINYYLPNMTGQHIGHDMGQETEYRKMKDEGLANAQSVHDEQIRNYETSGNYYFTITS